MPEWVSLSDLKFKDRRSAVREFNRFARAITEIQATASAEDLEDLRQRSLRDLRRGLKDYQALRAGISLLVDLAKQGWEIAVRSSVVRVRKPDRLSDAMKEKQRVREQLHSERDNQLRKPSVVKFIQSMERRRIHDGRFVSIFSLMRDGRGLAQSLRTGRGLPERDLRRLLRKHIRPYLQFITTGQRDEHTGFLLQDIWRYFRHTWSNPYNSLPGRGLQILVRDAAADNHPVIGIAALGSAAVQIRCRDESIGWTEETVLTDFAREPTTEKARWLRSSLNAAIARIHTDDLLEDEVITRRDLQHPDRQVVKALEQEAKEQRKNHTTHANSAEFKKPSAAETAGDAYWLAQARTDLFRSKRAVALAKLLRAKAALDEALGRRPSKKRLVDLLSTTEGRRAASIVVRHQKGERVGVSLADIVVCGSVAPYNALLGGKLVSMLMASPELTGAYFKKFSDTPSVIASSMAGRRVVKCPKLVFLGTTSLYGVGSSQYNRIAIPCERVGGTKGERIRYQRLGQTQGFGSSQFGEATMREIGAALDQGEAGQRVNYVFGEGMSPKFRRLRGGLDLLGYPSDALLNHGSPRLVYGVSLAKSCGGYLLGLDDEPDYLIPQRDPQAGTAQLVEFWRDRWLSKRVQREDVLERVEGHTLVRPVKHGARVLGVPEVLEEVLLFDDLWA